MSLNRWCATFKALQTAEDTPVISDEDREDLFDVLCCFIDFTECAQGKVNSRKRDAHNYAMALNNSPQQQAYFQRFGRVPYLPSEGSSLRAPV